MSNAYEVFDLLPTYELASSDLESRYLQAAAACHPDQFSDPLDQAEAAEKAAAINQAYRILKDPLSRAEELLRIVTGQASEKDVDLPPDFLMEMMERREALEEALGEQDKPRAKALATQAQQDMQQVLHDFSEHTQSCLQHPDEETLAKARLALAKARYFKRMADSARQK